MVSDIRIGGNFDLFVSKNGRLLEKKETYPWNKNQFTAEQFKAQKSQKALLKISQITQSSKKELKRPNI